MANYNHDCVAKYVLVSTSPAIGEPPSWAAPSYLMKWLRSQRFLHVVASICDPMLEQS